MVRLLCTGAWVALIVLGTSCSFVPNATVRVGIPVHDPEARALWATVSGVDVVTPDAFPPPDLVWFEGSFESPAFDEEALGFNAEVEAEARAAGLAPGWVNDTSDRILPVLWSPWAWWVTPDRPTPPSPGHPLIPWAQGENLAALAVVTSRSQGPVLGQDAASAVWALWGKPPRDEGTALTNDQALEVWARGGHDRVWLDWATVSTHPGANLVPEEAPLVPVRVRGLWWNARGWNRDRVLGLLKQVWSAPVQTAWSRGSRWLPVNTRVPLGPGATRVEALGTRAQGFLPVQTPANE